MVPKPDKTKKSKDAILKAAQSRAKSKKVKIIIKFSKIKKKKKKKEMDKRKGERKGTTRCFFRLRPL